MTASTEIDVRPPSQATAIPAKIAYARALAESGLLPGAYRKQPSNVLWAIEYGDMLGLSPMAAITGIHVIEGKPSISAGLISALVRRAGHKLRVSGDADTATCQIIRSDDRGYTFAVTFTAKDAQAAGLLTKDVWKKYRPSMLKARAITQCARDACEEALFGLHYTPEELGAEVDEDGVVIARIIDEHAADDDTRPWIAQALERARTFKTDADGQELQREAAAAALDGRCSTGQSDHVQNTVTDELNKRHRKLSAHHLRQLSENDEWRAAVEEIADGDDETARNKLEELRQLIGAGTMDEGRAGRIGRAIIALCPRAAITDADVTA